MGWMFRSLALAALILAAAAPAAAQYKPAPPSAGYVCRIIQDTVAGRMDLTARIGPDDHVHDYTITWRPPGATVPAATWRGVEDASLAQAPTLASGAAKPDPAALKKALAELRPLKTELDELIDQHRNRCPLAGAQ
jgi:hypothetical protein